MSAAANTRAHAFLLALLALFVALGSYQFIVRTPPRGDDLASSYLGCRLLAHGQAAHLFSWDEDQFADTGDDDALWDGEAAAGGYRFNHHPYVQTPLWAWSLRPLCESPWLPFERLFTVLALVAFAGCAWLAARFWSQDAWFALALSAALLLWLWCSQPFLYAMYLAQTHVFFVFLTLAALVLAERGRPWSAGLALALAAGVKVTPAVFILYWLVSRRRKAAVSAVSFSALLLVAGYVATGPALMLDYFATLARTSHTLLLAINNQSLAAWWMGFFYPRSEAERLTIYWLPTAVRLTAECALLLVTVLGGLLDRARAAAPAGAMLTLVASSVFAPIAWTHYGIVLYAPLFVLLVQLRELRWWWMLFPAGLTAALNLWPLTPDLVHAWWPVSSLLRAQFYAWVLSMLALGATGVGLVTRHQRRTGAHPEPLGT